MTVCMYILPRVLKRYRSLYPQVDLRVVSGPSETILRKIRAREIDLALLTLPIVGEDLEVVPVLKEEMVVVTAPGHPLSRDRSVEAKSLGKFPLILYESGSNTRRVLDQFLDGGRGAGPGGHGDGERGDHQGHGGARAWG